MQKNVFYYEKLRKKKQSSPDLKYIFKVSNTVYQRRQKILSDLNVRILIRNIQFFFFNNTTFLTFLKDPQIIHILDEYDSFEELPLRTKVTSLYLICEILQDRQHIAEHIQNLGLEKTRLNAVGIDSNNCKYWYFGGIRLYKENIKSAPDKQEWKTICFTYSDWNNIINELQNSNHSIDNELSTLLRNKKRIR